MVGADPKLWRHERAGRVLPDAALSAPSPAPPHRTVSHRWHWIALLGVLVPLSFVLVQCGKAPSAGMLAANAHASAGDSFEDRFPAPTFSERFPAASESLAPAAAAPRGRTARAEPETSHVRIVGGSVYALVRLPELAPEDVPPGTEVWRD